MAILYEFASVDLRNQHFGSGRGGGEHRWTGSELDSRPWLTHRRTQALAAGPGVIDRADDAAHRRRRRARLDVAAT
jgi:hypothetical protein